jgi:hypothetical protein
LAQSILIEPTGEYKAKMRGEQFASLPLQEAREACGFVCASEPSSEYVAAVKFCLVITVLFVATLWAQSDPVIVSARCGADQKTHLMFRGGKETAVPWLAEQSGCDDVKISADHHSAGWVIFQSGAIADGTSPIATGVTIFSANRPVRHYGDGLVVWDWRFAGADRVVLSTNTAHGPQTNDPHFVLYDLNSGKLLRKWNGVGGSKVPSWAAGLRY